MSKPDPKDFYIHKQSNATIVRLPGSVQGYDLTIEDLTDCVVYILDHSAQITVDYCTNTRFVLGPIDGPLFLRNCTNCSVTVACRQLRTRECVDCDLFLYCATKSPIIESSSNLRFHQFDAAWPGLTAQFAAAKLNPAVNYNDLIYDFSANDASIPQPHSSIIAEVPPLRLLRCFLDGQQIDGAIDDTPLSNHVAYPSRTEERVEKTSSPAAASPSPSPDAAAAAPAVMESFGSASAAKPMESFGSGSIKKMESFGSGSAATAASSVKPMESFGSKKMESFGSSKPMESFGSSSIKAVTGASATPKMESFGSASIKAAEVAAVAALVAASPAFEEGMAPSIPSEPLPAIPAADEPSAASAESVKPPTTETSPVVAEPLSADSAAATIDADVAPAAAATSAAAAAASASEEDGAKVIVKEATFSIQTSAEDASRALFALAGVEYKEDKKPAAPVAPAPAVDAAAASSVASPSSSSEDEEARLAAWISSTPGMVSSGASLRPEQEAQMARVAAAEARRLEGLERRRKAAEEAAKANQEAASASMKEFYQQREAELAERRKAMNPPPTATNSTKPMPSVQHTHPDHSNAAAAAAAAAPSTLPDAMTAALHALSSAAASAVSSSSSFSSAAAASASSVDAGWAFVLSMLPPGAVAQHSAAEVARMKALYTQLKGSLDRQRGAAQDAERKAKKEERKQKKKEKKKRKRAKRREHARATAAALAAAVIAAGGQPPPPLPDSSSDDSSSSSSDDED